MNRMKREKYCELILDRREEPLRNYSYIDSLELAGISFTERKDKNKF